MATRPGTRTKSSTQVAVRLPNDIHAALAARGPSIAGQLVAAAREYLRRRDREDRRLARSAEATE